MKGFLVLACLLLSQAALAELHKCTLSIKSEGKTVNKLVGYLDPSDDKESSLSQIELNARNADAMVYAVITGMQGSNGEEILVELRKGSGANTKSFGGLKNNSASAENVSVLCSKL